MLYISIIDYNIMVVIIMKLKHRILLLIYSYLNFRHKVKKVFQRKKTPKPKEFKGKFYYKHYTIDFSKEVKDKYENSNKK